MPGLDLMTLLTLLVQRFIKGDPLTLKTAHAVMSYETRTQRLLHGSAAAVAAPPEVLSVYTVSQKRDPDIIDCNFGKD